MKKTILYILERSKKEVIMKIIASLFVRGLLLVIPIYWSKTINNLTLLNINKAYYLVILLLIFSVLYYGWEYLNQRSWFKLYNKLYIEYTNLIVENSKLEDITLAEFINIVNNDLDIICTFMGNSVTRVIQILEFIFIYSYFLSINIYIFIVTIIISLIMLMLLIVSGKNVQRLNMRRKSYLDKKTIMLNNFFVDRNEKTIIDYEGSNNSYLNANYNYNMITNGIIYIILACIELSQYGIIFYSIYLVSIKKLEIGTIVLIYTYFAKIIANFQVLGTINADYQSFIVSLRRLQKIKD